MANKLETNTAAVVMDTPLYMKNMKNTVKSSSVRLFSAGSFALIKWQMSKLRYVVLGYAELAVLST